MRSQDFQSLSHQLNVDPFPSTAPFQRNISQMDRVFPISDGPFVNRRRGMHISLKDNRQNQRMQVEDRSDNKEDKENGGVAGSFVHWHPNAWVDHSSGQLKE
mmetsp:Transcript_82752/g.124234  ORF Transcript_82752/g.124234 Transcript_82752/m.124234 type:complete len:102 (-) Transcript_82752:644-949(-)